MATDFHHGVETIEDTSGIRPVKTVKSAVVGIVGTAPDADNDVFPMNEPVAILGDRRKLLDLGTTGTLPPAFDDITDQGVMPYTVVVRVEEGADIDETRANAIGSSGSMTGVHALLHAQSEVKLTPKILLATELTAGRVDNAKNPVMAEFEGISVKLRSVILGDAAGADAAAAIAYAEDFGSDRVFITDPYVKVYDTATASFIARPASARVAGIIAKTDQQKGFWYSPSNTEILGIGGTARPIPFGLNDLTTEANQLNENKVATIVHLDGYRLWGNRSTASDPLWAFLSVRRTADMVYESIEQSSLWLIDKPFSEQLLRDGVGFVEAYLRTLQARGAILGFRVWLDPELNSPTELAAGRWYLNFDIEPPAPAERLTFMVARNINYYSGLVENVIKSIAA